MSDVYAAYRDHSDEPKLTKSCVLFFDILGTSAMSVSADASKYLRRLRPALEDAVKRAGTDDRGSEQASTWFTDNAVVASPLVRSEDGEPAMGGLEVAAAYLLLVCWGRGFLGRGAITVGAHYMDERFVFGPALIEAVDLEKAARWPRVVLGADAIALERLHSRYYAHPLQSAQSTCLNCDEDGVVFVDHLGVYIDEEDNSAALDHFLTLHRQATETGLGTCAQGSEPWNKWRWLAEYQNHAILSRHRDPEPYLVTLSDRRHEFRDLLDPAPYTPPGSPWYVLDRQQRVRATSLAVEFLPAAPGVYALYRDGLRVYVGATNDLLRRCRDEHLGRSPTIGNSALRRQVAELLKIASASDIRARKVRLSDSEVQRVADWIAQCEIGWQECRTEAAAQGLAFDLKQAHKPPLN